MVSAGGAATGVAELSGAMVAGGHDVTVYIRRDDPDSPGRMLTVQGYTVVRISAGPSEPVAEADQLDHLGTFAHRLADSWAADRPDVAHAHGWMSGVATQLAARDSQVPTVQTFHGLGRGTTGPRARRRLERLIARDAGWVAARCTREAVDLIRMGRSRTGLSVVPYGVDLDLFSTSGDTAARGGTPRIIAAGRALEGKGFDIVIAALPAIADAEFVIVGGPDRRRLDDDPEVRRLRALAQRLGVGQRVRFTGAVDRQDMPALLRSADVVACTAWFEPFGTVPLEAMACGVPVVASAVGGLVDSVVHDVTGRLVPPGRPRECAAAVSAILQEDFLRRSLGLAGRDRACARYSWCRVAEDTVRIYDRLATERAGV